MRACSSASFMARAAFAIVRRRRHMVGVRRKSVTGKLAVNSRVTRFRVFEFLDHDDAGAFAHDETVTVAIEWAGSALRFIIASAQSFHRSKPGQTNRDDGGLGAAGQKSIR